MTRHYMIHLNSMGDEDSKTHNMENCLLGIAEWTPENRHKFNNEKTEFIVFASERQRHKVTSMDVGVDGINVGELMLYNILLDRIIFTNI